MKKIIQKTLILAALMIAVVFLVSYIIIGTTEETEKRKPVHEYLETFFKRKKIQMGRYR